MRETLNNIENPFQNLQNLAESGLVGGTGQHAQLPQIQVIPAAIPEPPKPEKAKEETHEEPAEEPVEKEKVEEKIEPTIEEPVKVDGKGDEVLESFPEPSFPEPEEVMEEEGGIVQEYVAEPRVQKPAFGIKAIKKYDIVTLFNLMEWVKGMLEKYNLDSLTIMLEFFESAGYISEDAREFICKIAELVSLNDGFEDMLLELYRLHKLMNPEDTSMDSKLLNLILDKRL